MSYPVFRRPPGRGPHGGLAIDGSRVAPLEARRSRCRRFPRPHAAARGPALTIARRSLCNSIQAVSYRRRPNCRWSRSADIAPLVGDRQIGRPEPDGQRRLRVVEDRACGQRDLIPARRTLPPPMLLHAVGAAVPAPRASKPVRPATRRQVVLTGFLGRELTLEIAHILRKWRARHILTLHMVAC